MDRIKILSAILAAGYLLYLSACGLSNPSNPTLPTEILIPENASTFPPSEPPAPPTETVIPPTETVPPSIAKPGATFVGTIAMGSATSAQIILKVSEDGRSIESVGVEFTGLNCEGFTAGSSSTTVDGQVPILDDRFEFESSAIGEISGQFTSPTTVEGSIHVLINPGIGNPIECGTWDWSATGE